MLVLHKENTEFGILRFWQRQLFTQNSFNNNNRGFFGEKFTNDSLLRVVKCSKPVEEKKLKICVCVCPLCRPTLTMTQRNLTGGCNVNCGCKIHEYAPVCGSDGITYFNPCLAGCSSVANDSTGVRGGAKGCRRPRLLESDAWPLHV